MGLLDKIFLARLVSFYYSHHCIYLLLFALGSDFLLCIVFALRDYFVDVFFIK
jgi:hypothetical protein